MFIAKDIDGNDVKIEEAELFEKENPGVKENIFVRLVKIKFLSKHQNQIK